MSISGGCIRWRGMPAVYTPEERGIMRLLPVSEQAVVHTLKALMDGEIQEGIDPPRVISNDLGESERPPTFTDPEDLEFGDKRKSRKRPIYALVTTWRQWCRVPTKREGEFWTKVWKAWYERQGWKVTSHPSGYFATSPAGEKVAITLHEYDAETHERLN